MWNTQKLVGGALGGGEGSVLDFELRRGKWKINHQATEEQISKGYDMLFFYLNGV
jgi:hypothetical protein